MRLHLVALQSVVVCVMGLLTSFEAVGQRFSAFDQSLVEVRHGIDKRVSCRWWIPSQHQCVLDDTRGNLLTLEPEKSSDKIESIELIVLAQLVGESEPQMEVRSRATAIRLVQYFLPEWRHAANWTRQALQTAQRKKRHSTVRIGAITVLVKRHLYADLEHDFALIVLTRKASLDDWIEKEDDED